jgi:hypothetical protein
MTMTTIKLKRTALKGPITPLALAVFWTLLASFTGSAFVERMEKRAVEDRLSFGTMADTCARATCSPSHFAVE